MRKILPLIVIALCGAGLNVRAQAPAPIPTPGAPRPPARPAELSYGAPITLEQARVVIAAAEAEAARRKVHATLAVVEPSGALVFYVKATDAPYSAEEMAVKKARASARTRRPTSYDAERYAAGVTAITAVENVFPFGGGQPIVLQGRVVGGIGATGGADDDVARAGARALQ